MSDSDPLTARLRELRADLDSAQLLLNERNFDAVRKVTDEVGTAMTFSGYTGESVKARARRGPPPATWTSPRPSC